jgi:hypothetical protein
MKLEPIELQQSQEEGRHRRHELGEEDQLPWWEAGERKGAASHPVIIPQ